MPWTLGYWKIEKEDLPLLILVPLGLGCILWLIGNSIFFVASHILEKYQLREIISITMFSLTAIVIFWFIGLIAIIILDLIWRLVVRIRIS